MKKVSVFVVILYCLFSLPSFGVQKYTGIFLAPNISRASYPIKSKWGPSFDFGVRKNYLMDSVFIFEAGIQVNNYFPIYKFVLTDPHGNNIGTYTFYNNSTYLSIPLLFGFKTKGNSSFYSKIGILNSFFLNSVFYNNFNNNVDNYSITQSSKVIKITPVIELGFCKTTKSKNLNFFGIGYTRQFYSLGFGSNQFSQHQIFYSNFYFSIGKYLYKKSN